MTSREPKPLKATPRLIYQNGNVSLLGYKTPAPVDYESHLWDSFLYAAADADFAGPAVTLRCPDILQPVSIPRSLVQVRRCNCCLSGYYGTVAGTGFPE